jgi:hypothetical protein
MNTFTSILNLIYSLNISFRWGHKFRGRMTISIWNSSRTSTSFDRGFSRGVSYLLQTSDTPLQCVHESPCFLFPLPLGGVSFSSILASCVVGPLLFVPDGSAKNELLLLYYQFIQFCAQPLQVHACMAL